MTRGILNTRRHRWSGRAGLAGRLSGRAGLAGLLASVMLTASLSACGMTASGSPESQDLGVGAATPAAAVAASALPVISLGSGFVSFPDAADAWVAAHRTDPRAALIASKIASQPTALWLTGNESFANLRQAVALAKAKDGTLTLALWNIPLRYDGLSTPSPLTSTEYATWINTVATTIGSTRAIIVLEPDALWFYDRMPTAASRTARLQSLNNAVNVLKAKAPRTRVYIDAGTSSGSVTPQRMATLLAGAGVAKAAGFAVNISSYAPELSIRAYAQAIRAALQHLGIADPRYVVDTGRNGATSWDNNWCNPPQQRLGRAPVLIRATNGVDLDLWIKAPGTSDGNCGPVGGGKGTSGGEFMPAVAYKMITG